MALNLINPNANPEVDKKDWLTTSLFYCKVSDAIDD